MMSVLTALGPWGWALIGYVIGSIPFGLVLTRLAGLGDIRSIGSGNIGATNVLRTGKRWLALATLLLDMVKGAVPVLLAAHFAPEHPALAGIGAFLGHLFPVWLGFRGGKGVATFIGVLAALQWQVMVVVGLAWLLMAAVLRYSSLAALVASLCAPAAAAVLGRWDVAAASLGMAALIWLKHSANIRRLLTGKEPKIGQKDAVDPFGSDAAE